MNSPTMSLTCALFLLAIVLPLRAASYEKRSGDIIVNDLRLPQAQFSYSVDVPKITTTQLYDILARYFGAPRTPFSSELKINIDLFDRPRGNILFSIEGLSSNRLTKPNYRTFATAPIVDLVPSNDGQNAFSTLGTVLTGSEIDVHGVVNKKWPGKGKDEKTYPFGNFFDAVIESRGAKVVSAAGSADALSVISPSTYQKTFTGVRWDGKSRGYVSEKNSRLGISRKNYSGLLKKLGEVLDCSVMFSEEENVVTVVRDGHSVLFDLSQQQDEALIAEVLFVINAAAAEIPERADFFTFHSESLKSIFSKYGQSEEYDAAVSMLDAAIAHLVETYGTDYALTLLYFPSLHDVQPVQTAIETVLKDHVIVPSSVTTWYSFFPHFYLGAKAKAKSGELCESLRQVLSEYDVTVSCDRTSPSLKRALQQSEPTPQPSPFSGPQPSPLPPLAPGVPQPAPSPPGPPVANQATIALVHIVLWTCLFFLASLIFSCYQLAVVDGSNEPEFKANSFETLGGGRAQTQKVQ